VAAERHGVAAFLMPPSDDLRVERDGGVDFEDAAGACESTEERAVFVFEGSGLVGAGRGRWPGAHRVVDVGEHFEWEHGFDQAEYFGEVDADHLMRVALAIES